MKKAAVTLFFSVAALTALGLVMLVSARIGAKEGNFFVLQSIWCVVGLAACWTAGAVDYRIFKRLPWVTVLIFLAVLGLLVLVLVPGIGVHTNGSSRWLRLGPISMQPSELAK